MKCEFCNKDVTTHTALCGNCGKFGRTVPQYIKYHNIDVPEKRICDFNWLKRNAMIRNSDHPAFPRLIEMLKEI